MRIRLMMCLSLFLFITVKAQENDLQLKDLVNAALEHNQSLKNVDLEVEKSEIIRKQILHTYIPTLEASGLYAYNSGTLNVDTDPLPFTSPELTLPVPDPISSLIGPTLTIPSMPLEVPAIDHGFDFNSNLWQAGLTAKWTLFTGLKAPMLLKAMEHKIAAQEQMKAQSQAEVISQVTYYYDKIALLKQSEILLKENQKRLDRENVVAKRALEEGLITRHDFQRIEIAKLELQSKLVEYNGAQMMLYLKLKQLTGIPTISLEKMDVELVPMLKATETSTFMNRPEVAALDEAITAAEYKAKSELSGYLPKIQAFASHQYMGSTNGEFGDMTYSEISAYPMNMIGVGFKWELFDGLHTHGEHQKAMIEVSKQENRKLEVLELLELNYENCLTSYHTALAKVDLNEKKKQVSQENLEITYKEFQNGLVNLSDFLESQTEHEKVVLEYYDIVFTQRQSTVNLMKATGMLKANSL